MCYFSIFLLFMSSHREKLMKWSKFSLSLTSPACPSCCSYWLFPTVFCIMKSRLSSGTALFVKSYKRSTGGFLIATCLSSLPAHLMGCWGFKATAFQNLPFGETLSHQCPGLGLPASLQTPCLACVNHRALNQFCRWDLTVIES